LISLPKISIIVPCYNSGQFIIETIESLINQDYKNLELILVDGASSDNTIELIKRYDKHISHILSEPDYGQTDAINKGFQLATGYIISWLNADDILLPNALKIISNEFLNNIELEVLCAKEYSFTEDSKIPYLEHGGSVVCKSVEKTFYFGIIDQPCTFFKKSSIDKYFPLTVSLKYVMDRELWLSYLCENGVNNIKCIDNQLTAFRLHQNSKTVSEGHLFEKEFAGIKVQILKALSAPVSLIAYMQSKAEYFLYDSDRFIKYNWKFIDKGKLLSTYAYECANNAYVNNNLFIARKMSLYILSTGYFKFNYFYLFAKTIFLPKTILIILKKIKKLF
jgi:glycosyltransferase involved in cell wall biosynthesis